MHLHECTQITLIWLSSELQHDMKVDLRYRKIPKISPGAYIFQRPFLRGLYSEGLSMEGKFALQNRLGSSYSWKEINLFCFVSLCIWEQLPSTSPRGAYICRGDLTEGFLRYEFGGAYIWRGLYTAGLIFGMLRYLQNWLIANRLTLNMLIKDLIRFMHSLSRKRQNRESKRKALIVPHSSAVGVDTYGPRSRGILPRLHLRCGFSHRSV